MRQEQTLSRRWTSQQNIMLCNLWLFTGAPGIWLIPDTHLNPMPSSCVFLPLTSTDRLWLQRQMVPLAQKNGQAEQLRFEICATCSVFDSRNRILNGGNWSKALRVAQKSHHGPEAVHLGMLPCSAIQQHQQHVHQSFRTIWCWVDHSQLLTPVLWISIKSKYDKMCIFKSVTCHDNSLQTFESSLHSVIVTLRKV